VVRRLVDEAFSSVGMSARVVAEIESPSTLTAVISEGLGATILPASIAGEVVAQCAAWQAPLVDPVIEAPLALCQSAHLPLSEPAQAVKEIILELVAEWPGNLLPDSGCMSLAA
jgi:LysR family nitrogen assimilation transcriptional regulator